jgi:hypothetical protein
MLARLAPLFDLPADWQPLAVPVIGLVSAGLALYWGRAIFGRRTGSTSGGSTRKSGRPERRKSSRHRGQPVKVLLADMDPRARPHTGLLLDRSLSGMRLSLTQAPTVGTILSIRAPEAPPSAPWVQMEVKYCFLQEDTWLVGCKFVQAPSWSVLQLFD